MKKKERRYFRGRAGAVCFADDSDGNGKSAMVR